MRSVRSESTAAKDDNGQVVCMVCKKFKGHVLLEHLQEAHGMNAVEYNEKHNSPVFSPLGADIIKAKFAESGGGALSLTIPERGYDEITVAQLFDKQDPWKGEKTVKVRKFRGTSPMVPVGDDSSYVYPYDATIALLFAIGRQKRNSVWLSGYSGTGKTQLVVNICRRLNRELFRVNLDSAVTRSDLIGDWTVQGGQTVFKYGVLPHAMSRGAVLLLDEFDLINPYLAATLRPVLEEFPSLTILENGGEVITPHPDFRVIVTANTFGSGDESGLYGTTHSLSVADRQRFGIFILVDYPSPEDEVKLLTRAVPDLDEPEAQKFVQVATRIREQFKERKIEESISPRQLVNFADIYTECASIYVAANMSFLHPLSKSSQMAINAILQESGLAEVAGDADEDEEDL